MRYPEIRMTDIFAAQVFHALRIGGQWVWTEPAMCGIGLCSGGQYVISKMADRLFPFRPQRDQPDDRNGSIIARIELSAPVPAEAPLAFLTIDRAGNSWVGREYLPPDKYLPMVLAAVESAAEQEHAL